MPRGTIEPDVTGANISPAALPPVRPTQYRRLTAVECRKLAIQNAPLADDLDSHPDNQTSHACSLKKRSDQAQLSRLVRGYAADDLRNRAAGDALELYYKLATAEGQFDHTSSAHGILRTQLALAEKAIKAGAADRADVERIRRQLLELESQLAKLEAGIASLNAGLAGHLGLDPADQTPIWPADTLTVSGDVPDVEQSVRTALQCRPDLNMLRTLATSENSGQLAKAVVTGINPLLGTKESANPLFAPLISFMAVVKKEPTQAEAKMQRQLLGALATRERQADAEVRAAVAMVRGNRLAVAAKAAEVRNWQARVAEAEKRVAAGVAGAEGELALAKVELLKARGELIQAVAEYQISDVKLRQAMGLLVRE
ncbi:MAG: TolC family protein [Planctomycetes bacterium]|nr:TolC family protein [Planctomycetota bacterium]